MGKVLKAVHFNSGFCPAFLENLLIFFILHLEIKHSTKAFLQHVKCSYCVYGILHTQTERQTTQVQH